MDIMKYKQIVKFFDITPCLNGKCSMETSTEKRNITRLWQLYVKHTTGIK